MIQESEEAIQELACQLGPLLQADMRLCSMLFLSHQELVELHEAALGLDTHEQSGGASLVGLGEKSKLTLVFQDSCF